MKKIFLLCLTVLLAAGCKKEDKNYSTNNNTFSEKKVYGVINNFDSNGSEIKLVLFNAQKSYTTKATLNGEFEFSQVLEGEYKLNAIQNNSNGCVEKTIKVNVTDSINVINLKLPKPVILNCIDFTSKSISLNWNECSEDGFREYKIFKGYNTALDENTGQLIHITTSRIDTIFKDTSYAMNSVNPNTNYYYRIFVMDEMGKIGGSNILHVKTKPIETNLYTLNMISNYPINGEFGTISGIASDGNFLWVASRIDIGGFYDKDKIILSKYNLTDYSLVDTITFNDRIEPIGGLTFDGQYLWLSYSASGTGSNLIYQINPETGLKIKSYSTDYGIRGLGYNSNKLFLNYYYNKIEIINSSNGSLTKTITPNDFEGNGYGIAVRDNEIWLTARIGSNYILVLNSDGTKKGTIQNTIDFSQICFHNNKLILANEHRIYLYNINNVKK